MLAMLEYSKTGAGHRYLEEAVRLFWRILEWIRNPALLDRPLDGRPAPGALADIMVTASMALELSSVHSDDRYVPIMRECLGQALLHHDPARNILIEHTGAGGGRVSHLPEGRLFNPGHSVETAWFLLQLADRLNDRSAEGRILDIIEGSLTFGWDREYGGLYYFMDVEGKPTLQLEAGMKLWWPHTEALYAVILAYTRTGESRWLEWLERLHDYTFRHFVDEARFGEWFGYCDRRGNLTHTLKGNNYKGCFHVPRFLLMAIQRIEAPPAPRRRDPIDGERRAG
jgi:N-acylglucosamine 2-epimerase